VTDLATLDEHLRAENENDLASIMATHFADPAVRINRRLFAGAVAVGRFRAKFGFGGDGAFSEVYVRELRRRAAGRVVVIEQRLSGRHTGTWRDMAPTHRAFSVPVCTVYSLDEQGALIAEEVYFDSVQILAQLRGDLGGLSRPLSSYFLFYSFHPSASRKDGLCTALNNFA